MLLLLPAAFANGQTSHQWITLQALEALPDGELRDFLTDPALDEALLNGTMFPDGGYAVGDDYGEMAHWEPLQLAYLDDILARGGPPFDDALAQELAFFFGMASHGMADQVYDSTYMERAKALDPEESWACCSMDEATDVAFAALTGAGTVPEAWWPEGLLPLFAAQGHTVEGDTVDSGQDRLGIAILFVGAAGENPEAVAEYHAEFPWACDHQLDEAVPGNPPREAELVARYWEALWERVGGGDGLSEPVLGLAAGEVAGQPREAESVEARIGLVFARGLDPESVEGRVHVYDEQGAELPVRLDVFYGTASHVLNLHPEADWPEAQDLELRVEPGVLGWDGQPLLEDTWTTTLSTRPPEADPAPTPEADCGCRSSPLPWLMLPLLRRRRRAEGPA